MVGGWWLDVVRGEMVNGYWRMKSADWGGRGALFLVVGCWLLVLGWVNRGLWCAGRLTPRPLAMGLGCGDIFCRTFFVGRRRLRVGSRIKVKIKIMRWDAMWATEG